MAKGETDDGVAQSKGDFPCWGMTLRDYFAGQALGTMVGRQDDPEWFGHCHVVAEVCYRYADAMLEVRKR